MPRSARVRALEQSAARASGAEVMRLTTHVPHGGIEHTRILRVHRHLRASGAVVAVEKLRPGLAAVGGFENAALHVRIPQVTESACVHRVAVLRIDHNTADVLGVGKSDGFPVLAAIARAINASANRYAVAHPGLTRSHPNGLRVGRINR